MSGVTCADDAHLGSASNMLFDEKTDEGRGHESDPGDRERAWPAENAYEERDHAGRTDQRRKAAGQFCTTGLG